MDIEEAFKKFVSVKRKKLTHGMRWEAKCKKGLFCVEAREEIDAICEARHYFAQYFSDGEYSS